VLVTIACDIPTTAPIVDTRWVVPVESTRFGVGELLPGAVSITGDSSAFVIDFAPVSFSASLATLCSACTIADGLTVPKPAFSDGFGSQLDFPSRISSVTILDGALRVRITNGLNFDPLRPANGVFGSLSIQLTDGSDGEAVGELFVDGAVRSLAPGTTLDLVLPFEPVTLDGVLETSVSIVSPAGDPVGLDSNLPLSVSASVEALRISEVAIDVSGESVSLDPASFDLDDIGDELTDRVLSGALVLDVQNPFEVGAGFQVSIIGSTFAAIQRVLSIQGLAGESIRVDFTGSEIRNILSAPSVQLGGGAVVDGAAGIIRVRPGQELVLDASLDLELRIGG
jgi:hypothetical protein